MKIERIDPGPRMSEAVVHGDRIHLSGMIPEDCALDIAGQVRQALAEIDALLARAGTTRSNILTATIWLPMANPYSAWKVPATILNSLTPSIPKALPESPATGLRPVLVCRMAPSNVKLLDRTGAPFTLKLVPCELRWFLSWLTPG